MLNKMNKFDIFVPHPLVITSLVPLDYVAIDWVCVEKLYTINIFIVLEYGLHGGYVEGLL